MTGRQHDTSGAGRDRRITSATAAVSRAKGATPTGLLLPLVAALLLTISAQIYFVANAHGTAGTALGEDDAEVVSGGVEVRLGRIDDARARRKVAGHLRRTLPLLNDLYGPPPLHLKVDVVVDRSLGSGFRFSPDSCLAEDVQGSIWVGKPQELWVYVRALAEAYRACDRVPDQSFDGGMAEAVNQLVLQRVGVTAPWRMERVQYQVASRPGIGGGTDYRTDTFAALVSERFQLLATALRIFEEEHRGFFRRFNGVRAQKLSEGTPPGAVDQMAVAREAEPAFAEWSARQHLFDERPRGDQLLLVTQGDSVRLLAIRRDEFGKETPWANLPVTLNIDPLNKDVRRTTDAQGRATLELSEETYVRPGREVALRVHGDGRSDEFTFIPVPPDTSHAGPPHPWDLAVWAAGGGSLVFAWWSDRRGRRTVLKSGPTSRVSRATPVLRLGALVAFAALSSSIALGGSTRAAARLDNARWLRRAEPELAATLRAAPQGERVVVMGLIDPVSQPVDRARGFALYVGEYFSTDSTWEWDYTIAPPFTVVLGDGPVEVVNGCRDARGGWSIATPAYNDDCYKLLHLPVTEYNGDGNDRYRGFKPGDPVLVFGVAQAGGVVASAVSGGDLDEYAASVSSDAWTRVAIAILWSAIAVTLWLRVAFLVKTRISISPQPVPYNDAAHVR